MLLKKNDNKNILEKKLDIKFHIGKDIKVKEIIPWIRNISQN